MFLNTVRVEVAIVPDVHRPEKVPPPFNADLEHESAGMSRE